MSKSYWVEWNDAMIRHDFESAKKIATEFHKEKGRDEYLKTFYYDAVFYENYLSTGFQSGINAIKSFYDSNPSIINEQSASYCAYRLYKYAVNTVNALFRPKWIEVIIQFDNNVSSLEKLKDWIDNTDWVINDHKNVIISTVNELHDHTVHISKINKRMNNRYIAIITTIVTAALLLISMKIFLISQGLL